MSAPHARTRERALALYEITQGSCATRVAARSGRHPQTIMGWVHAYNAQGPDALAFRRTGGRPPLRPDPSRPRRGRRSEEHTSELQSRQYLVCRLLLEKKKKKHNVKNHV